MISRRSLFLRELHDSRTEDLKVLFKPDYRGMWRGCEEKYSDRAHLIYELLQNADDAGAASARFVLEKDRLIFAHNGERHFTERDVSAVTGFFRSSKSNDKGMIGKFGIGFKSVFKYTDTPCIYDKRFRFFIDNYIVPTEIKDDFPDRAADETLFVLPFDKRSVDKQTAYNDIKAKLMSLVYPTLFLPNLLQVSYKIGNIKGAYTKNILKTHDMNNTSMEKICLDHAENGKDLYEFLWVFSRTWADFRYSVGFFMDKNNKLIPVSMPAFCFFPTKETTGLNFIINAPFMLTDSREGIRAGEKHNIELIDRLAKLSASAVIYLRGIGSRERIRLITDDILSVIPVNENGFREPDDTSGISFKPFYTSIKRVFETDVIIPTRDGYAAAADACWADDTFLTQLFDNTRLQYICGNANAAWGFVSLGRGSLQRNNKPLLKYLDSIMGTRLNEEDLIRGRYRNYYKNIKDIRGLDAVFIEKQEPEWLHKLYKWLSETDRRTELAETMPVFLNQNSKAAAAYDRSGKHTLFLPSPNIKGFDTVREDLLENEETAAFVRKMGIERPSARDVIYNIVIPKYSNGDLPDDDDHFMLFFKYYRESPSYIGTELIRNIRNLKFLTGYSHEMSQRHKCAAGEMYFYDEQLNEYFETYPAAVYVSLNEYEKLVGHRHRHELAAFLTCLGVNQFARIIEKPIYSTYGIQDLPKPRSAADRMYFDKEIAGCREIVDYIIENNSVDKSVCLWKQLADIGLAHSSFYNRDLHSILGAECRWNYSYNNNNRINGYDFQYFESSAEKLLRSAKWLLTRGGRFAAPSEITPGELSPIYDTQSAFGGQLIEFLGISDENIASDKETLIKYYTH